MKGWQVIYKQNKLPVNDKIYLNEVKADSVCKESVWPEPELIKRQVEVE